jgi:16S rRNA C1402 (ribose-2'-O) methylase RsmI
MTLTQLPLCHTTRISTMRKTCHNDKNNKQEKKLMKYIEEKSLAFMSDCTQKYPSVFFNSI